MAETINRFISKFSDKCCPFFKLFRTNIKFSLTLQQFKKYLTEPSLLSTPNEGEVLYVYLAVLKYVVSSILLREVD